jgi:hypothetical protein
MLNKKNSQFKAICFKTFSWLKNTFKLLKLRHDFNKSFKKTFRFHKSTKAAHSKLLYSAIETHHFIDLLEQTNLPVTRWMSPSTKEIYMRDFDEPEDFLAENMLFNLKDSCYMSIEFALRKGETEVLEKHIPSSINKAEFISYGNSIIKKFGYITNKTESSNTALAV